MNGQKYKNVIGKKDKRRKIQHYKSKKKGQIDKRTIRQKYRRTKGPKNKN